MTNYQLAATELALAHQRAERGTLAAGPSGERERALAGVMASARAVFSRYYPSTAGPRG